MSFPFRGCRDANLRNGPLARPRGTLFLTGRATLEYTRRFLNSCRRGLGLFAPKPAIARRFSSATRDLLGIIFARIKGELLCQSAHINRASAAGLKRTVSAFA
jgi:hypothetical protein